MNLKLIFTLLKSQKNFRFPKKSDVLLYDDHGIDLMKILFSNNNFSILNTRKEIINLPILIICLLNFKFKLDDYFFYYIKYVDPKIIVTHNDNYISFYNGPNVDSPLYHLQALNWMILNKINLGITNLNIRFGVNSSWHLFLALTNISILSLQLKFYLSSIIFAILSYSVLFKKKYLISDLYLFLSISFLLTYTLIHPFVNGPILNQLGNPEVDTVAMFLFIFCFYTFLKFYENDFKVNNSSINFIIIMIFIKCC